MLGRADRRPFSQRAHMLKALFSVGRFEGRREVVRVSGRQRLELVRRLVDGRDRTARRGIHCINVRIVDPPSPPRNCAKVRLKEVASSFICGMRAANRRKLSSTCCLTAIERRRERQRERRSGLDPRASNVAGRGKRTGEGEGAVDEGEADDESDGEGGDRVGDDAGDSDDGGGNA